MGEPGDRRVLIVAGEASGDHHAARLVEALHGLGPCRVRGVAGPALEAAGVERVVAMEDLAVLGFSGVVARLPRLWSAYHRLLSDARSFRPHAAVLVDSPGFNFRLGPALKRLGIPIFYYIAPQVWAWHAERAARMAGWVDRLAVIFPFEEPLFQGAGVNARFVGHPLLEGLEPEVDEATFRGELGLAAGTRILGLLPGSRRQELLAHLRPMLAAARELASGRPDVAVVVGLAPGLASGRGRPARAADDVSGGGGVARRGDREGDRGPGTPHVVRGRTHALQACATCCAVASGTATLETALFATPEVIVYRTGWLNFAIARRVVKLPRIGLPNIVAGAEVAPELIQGDLTAARLAAALAPWLDDPAARERQRVKLAAVRAALGVPGAAGRAAAWLWEMLA
ncbi:MAG: lipid-A-disaccharide synthase [Candidatus Eisenbacteria bacterium]|nr:lipid-A-disaccharide synthase [Candidatus Eisenbacteria bacterium]